jgi:hypothetical protein
VRPGSKEEECDDKLWDDAPLEGHCLACGAGNGGDGGYSIRGSPRWIPSTTATSVWPDTPQKTWLPATFFKIGGPLRPSSRCASKKSNQQMSLFTDAQIRAARTSDDGWCWSRISLNHLSLPTRGAYGTLTPLGAVLLPPTLGRRMSGDTRYRVSYSSQASATVRHPLLKPFVAAPVRRRLLDMAAWIL